MPRQRDPLSVFYDEFSGQLLELLRGRMYAWHTATITSPAGDPVDQRGLSAHERAMQRSVYYVLNSTDAAGPMGGRWIKNPSESLQVRWGEPRFEGGFLRRLFRTSTRQRTLYARLAPGETAHLYVPADGYVFNPDEQSQALNLGG